ncbi:Mu transposase C-terminal domain-containing protein [Ferrovibrio xuzhouensis]|uniref:Mu transposase C-terminal domain-containing protein n=1 Tax=Ferrovibrio xuzhouensis TaxID=1576914 RepID=A0ABV7VA17_9PROT
MFRIPLGKTVHVDGAPYRMHVITTGNDYVLENKATRAPITLSSEEFSARLAAGTLELDPGPATEGGFDPVQADFHSLPDGLKAKADRRHRYVEAMRGHAIPKTEARLKPLLATLAAEFGDTAPPSPRTVIRWLSRWEQAGGRDVRALVPRTHRRGNRTRRVDSDVLDLIEAVIDECYYRREKITTIAVHELVCGRLKAHNEKRPPVEHLPFPSLATVRRAIADRSPYEVMVARKGKHAADRKFMPVQAGPVVARPMEVLEIDHTPLDIILVDSATGSVIGRPNMTAAIDKYSRMIVGFYIGYEPPGTHTVMLCLRHAILNKQYVREQYPDIQNVWPCEGLPTTIMVDNGPEFHSDGFRSACAQLGINITYAPGRSPWFKSAIERFFGSQNTSLLHQIRGTTFSRSADRGDYPSEKQAAISLTDLQHIVHIWLIDYYSQRIHRLRGRSPIETWNDGVRLHGLTPPRSAADLDCLIGGYATRHLTRRGIELFNLAYCGEKVFDLLNRPHRPDMVEVRYDHGDLSYILVLDPLTRTYVKLPSTEPEYTAGLTLAQHKIILDQTRKRIQGQMSIGDLCTTRLAIQTKIDEMVGRTASLRRQTAKRIKRFQNTESDQPGFPRQQMPVITPTPSNDPEMPAETPKPVRDWVAIETED